MILPWMGGTPAVWNTCMVFFQAVLLAGYPTLTAAPLLESARHAAFHILLLSCCACSGSPENWFADHRPAPLAGLCRWAAIIPWLLGLSLVMVGPFFAVAHERPLLQALVRGHRPARC